MPIEIIGNRNTLLIGDDCIIERSEFCIEDDNCSIRLGNSTAVGSAHFAATEMGLSIDVGEDCMFARGIEVRTGDSHGIYDSAGLRLNAAQNVEIGEQVWVAMFASILKGARIGRGGVVGTRSLVLAGEYPSNSILAGIPAAVVRSDIRWSRKRFPSLNVEAWHKEKK